MSKGSLVEIDETLEGYFEGSDIFIMRNIERVF